MALVLWWSGWVFFLTSEVPGGANKALSRVKLSYFLMRLLLHNTLNSRAVRSSRGQN